MDKRQRYEEWRHKHLATPFLKGLRRRLLRFALFTALPAAAVVFAAQNGFDKQRMKDSLADAGKQLKNKVLRKKGGQGLQPGGAEQAESAAAAALKEAEQAILAAEQAQQAALQELQKSKQAPQKKGWF